MIEIMGVETILKLFDKSRLITVVEKSRDRNDPQESIELYNLGRMSFKNEYGELKKIYKDIDKISKLSHFKIFWKK